MGTHFTYKSTFNTMCHRRLLERDRSTPEHISHMPDICLVHVQLFVIRNVCFQLEVNTFSTSVPNFDTILNEEDSSPATNDANTSPPLGGLWAG